MVNINRLIGISITYATNNKSNQTHRTHIQYKSESKWFLKLAIDSCTSFQMILFAIQISRQILRRRDISEMCFLIFDEICNKKSLNYICVLWHFNSITHISLLFIDFSTMLDLALLFSVYALFKMKIPSVFTLTSNTINDFLWNWH